MTRPRAITVRKKDPFASASPTTGRSRRLIAMALVTAAAMILLVSSAFTQDSTPQPLTPDSTLGGLPTQESALEALIDLGWQNKAPLAIVIQGDSLCTHTFQGEMEKITVAKIIKRINEEIPGYTAELQHGVLVVRPKISTPSTEQALHLKIRNFSSAPTSIANLGIGLWMYIRAVLVPGQTSAFTGGLQNHAENIPSITVPVGTVESILNKLVSEGGGGIWVMHGVTSKWIHDPKTIPFEILSYSGQRERGNMDECDLSP